MASGPWRWRPRPFAVNVTVSAPTTGGSLTIWPGDTSPTLATVISYSAGQTRANSALVKTNASGGVSILCVGIRIGPRDRRRGAGSRRRASTSTAPRSPDGSASRRRTSPPSSRTSAASRIRTSASWGEATRSGTCYRSPQAPGPTSRVGVWCRRNKWWRRGESNPRPKRPNVEILHAQSGLVFFSHRAFRSGQPGAAANLTLSGRLFRWRRRPQPGFRVKRRGAPDRLPGARRG